MPCATAAECLCYTRKRSHACEMCGRKCKSSSRRRQLARAARKLKHIIVTGDDFGRSHEVNEAVDESEEEHEVNEAVDDDEAPPSGSSAPRRCVS